MLQHRCNFLGLSNFAELLLKLSPKSPRETSCRICSKPHMNRSVIVLKLWGSKVVITLTPFALLPWVFRSCAQGNYGTIRRYSRIGHRACTLYTYSPCAARRRRPTAGPVRSDRSGAPGIELAWEDVTESYMNDLANRNLGVQDRKVHLLSRNLLSERTPWSRFLQRIACIAALLLGASCAHA